MPEILVFFVSGMWCTTCSKSISSRVGRIAGVASAEVNFSSKLLTVIPNPEALSDLDRVANEILQTVQNLGFGIKRQTPGWIQTFREDLDREHAQAISTTMLVVVGFLAMWSSMIAFSGYLGGLEEREHYLVSCLSAALGIPAILLGLTPFLKAGVRALFRSRLITLDLFIGIGGISAVCVSLLNLNSGSSQTYADSAAMVLVVLLVAKIVEARLASYLSKQILHQIRPSVSIIQTYFKEQWRDRKLAQIRRGERVRFEAGDTITLDGTLKSETARVNSHLLNGEAGDLELQRESPVMAGSIARTSLEMVVQQPLGMRTIDGWAESALLSQGRPHAYSRLIRLLESRLTLVALAGAGVLGGVELVRSGEVQQAMEAFFVGVLIFCPCLFASIIPLTKQMAHLTLSKLGVLVQRAECLFDLNQIDHLYLDKTGTLEAVDSFYQPLCVQSEHRVRTLLGELARRCPHPVLNGLPREAGMLEELWLQEHPGSGVKAVATDDTLVVGRPEFVAEQIGQRAAIPDNGYPLVAFNGKVVGKIITQAVFNEQALYLVKNLLKAFPKTVPLSILSGDPNPAAGERFRALDPERISYHGNLSPRQKADSMTERGLFLGDGLNDTLALAKASVSCRLGNRVQGLAPADLQLMESDLLTLTSVVKYARRYLRILKQTALLAFSYNVVALSLAMAGLFNPLGAVLAMLGSLLVLTLSALRLLKLKGPSRNKRNDRSPFDLCHMTGRTKPIR